MQNNLPNWALLTGTAAEQWQRAIAAARPGQHVLVATCVGGGTGSAMSSVESLLAAALTARGARVSVLLCDQALPACKVLERSTQSDSTPVIDGSWRYSPPCEACARTGRELFAPLGLPTHRLGEVLTGLDRAIAGAETRKLSIAEIGRLRLGTRQVGQHALAGALRYFARGALDEADEVHLAVVRRFGEAAMLADCAFGRWLDRLDPDVVVTSHGIYVPFGLLRERCLETGRRFVAWNITYRRQSVIFSHGDTYHHTLMTEPVAEWEGLAWSEEREQRLCRYIESRRHGLRDWIWFFEKPEMAVDQFAARRGIPTDRPWVGLLTNVVWDAQVNYPPSAYGSMLDWLFDTIEHFARRPEVQLVIRVHPAEMRGTVPSDQRVADEIARRWPVLPGNIWVVGPEEPMSTYALLERCDSALVFGTKMGVELAAMGIPVIVAGEAWVRNKGVTTDTVTPAEYRAALAALPRGSRLDPAVLQRARKYAYHFFFRRMIPIAALQPASGGWPPFQVAVGSLDDLAPGADPGLDCVVAGILHGTSFAYDGPWPDDTD